MKREYAQKINSLLEGFHFNNEFTGLSYDHSLDLLRHGMRHLYYLIQITDEADVSTLDELRSLITRADEGEVPMPYDLTTLVSSEDAEPTITIILKEPPILSLELTLSEIESITESLTASALCEYLTPASDRDAGCARIIHLRAPLMASLILMPQIFKSLTKALTERKDNNLAIHPIGLQG